MRSRILLLAVSVVVAAISAAATYYGAASAAAEPAPQAVPRRDVDIELPREYEEIEAVIPQQTTMATVIEEHGLAEGEAAPLIEALGEHFDLRRVRAGQPYRVVRGVDGRIRELSYEIDDDRVLEARRRALIGEPVFDVSIAKIPKLAELAVVEGTIDRDQSSLIAAIEAAGEKIELSLAMADIFSGEMDFNADLQPGDTFRLLVEKQSRESGGTFAGYGPVLAAEFVNAGRRVRAVRFVAPDGVPGYYDEAGQSLKRFFLKSPLKFEPRVTSAFSRARRHPILDFTHAHNGVDYAAPSGASVGAVAGGMVTLAGWTGGGGRTVRVRHASGYESEYLHLSSIAVRAGARLAQGDLVGRVGSTGLATGPHLHYGLRLNGRYVNPVLEHKKMPPGDPVPTVHRVLFGTERDKLFGRLFATKSARADDDH